MPKIEKFSDEKQEMNFRKFLRIMKFKHRKNIMLHHIDRQIENQICQNNQINEMTRPKTVFDENFNIDPEQFENKEFQQNQNTASPVREESKLNVETPPENDSDIKEQIFLTYTSINNILIEFNLDKDIKPHDIDQNLILELQNFPMTPEKKSRVDELLSLVIKY